MDPIPVQCCCEPGRRLGYMHSPHLQRIGDCIRLAIRPAPYLLSADDPSRVAAVHHIELRVEALTWSGRIIPAINSHERSLAFWETVPGFVRDEGWLEA